MSDKKARCVRCNEEIKTEADLQKHYHGSLSIEWSADLLQTCTGYSGRLSLLPMKEVK